MGRRVEGEISVTSQFALHFRFVEVSSSLQPRKKRMKLEKFDWFMPFPVCLKTSDLPDDDDLITMMH